jgi:hypothetical protein
VNYLRAGPAANSLISKPSERSSKQATETDVRSALQLLVTIKPCTLSDLVRRIKVPTLLYSVLGLTLFFTFHGSKTEGKEYRIWIFRR